jgi:hypothetical protein
MPPLQFTDEEKDLLLELAAPIDQRQRQQFLLEVAAEIEAAGERTGGGPGPGVCIGSGAWSSGAFSIRPSSARANTAANPPS